MPRFVRALGVTTAMLLAHSPAAAAQDVARSFSELPGAVRADAPIIVMDSRFSEKKGTLVELTPSTLTVRVDDRLLTFAEADIVRIRQPRRDSLKNGAWWGAGVAAAVLTISGILHHEAGTGLNGTEWAQSIAVFTAMSTGIGVAIDALNETDRVIYAAPPRQPPSACTGCTQKVTAAKVLLGFQL